ncbi:MAG: hypothetical protein JO331_01780 [Verrucomicrobia bacterium]|nr:hypothetical protein [Verrucomicrobiota bacterium]
MQLFVCEKFVTFASVFGTSEKRAKDNVPIRAMSAEFMLKLFRREFSAKRRFQSLTLCALEELALFCERKS